MPSRDKESYSIQAVENALDVLEALSEIDDDVRISQLSEKLAMNKTSVFRLLATFENRGYVEREEQSGKYRLGLSAYEIGQKFLSRMGLLRHAKPLIERLARGCNEAVYVAVRRRKEVLFLDMVDTTQKVKIVSLVGKRFPLETTAAGQVLLAMKNGQSLKPAQGAPADLSQFTNICRQGYALDTFEVVQAHAGHRADQRGHAEIEPREQPQVDEGLLLPQQHEDPGADAGRREVEADRRT